jgi:hypothetical protein
MSTITGVRIGLGNVSHRIASAWGGYIPVYRMAATDGTPLPTPTRRASRTCCQLLSASSTVQLWPRRAASLGRQSTSRDIRNVRQPVWAPATAQGPPVASLRRHQVSASNHWRDRAAVNDGRAAPCMILVPEHQGRSRDDGGRPRVPARTQHQHSGARRNALRQAGILVISEVCACPGSTNASSGS